MRTIKACGLVLAILAGTFGPSAAQEACKAGADVLGVSRTVEIDTSPGPRYGVQYSEQSFLSDGEVVLTFDDGPLRAYTKHVLEALAAQCTKATFFLVGQMALADPEMVQEYAKRGHTIGSHTWSHANLQGLSPVRARGEIELGFSAVQAALGKPIAPFFRFPYLRDGHANIAYLQGRQVGMFSIDIDSKDYRTHDGNAVHRKVMADLARTKKGIILFHDIHASTARALPGILAELKAKGYRVVHMQPKTMLTTIPEYDALAQQELTRRRLVASGQPLAKRAFTWPLTQPSVPAEPAAAKDRGVARPSPHGRAEDWPTTIWR
jgi:peptidoglycan/xylan/chitin deacetylase (PgdA/CDA1 family)